MKSEPSLWDTLSLPIKTLSLLYHGALSLGHPLSTFLGPFFYLLGPSLYSIRIFSLPSEPSLFLLVPMVYCVVEFSLKMLGHRYYIGHEAQISVIDPELMTRILVKDFVTGQ